MAFLQSKYQKRVRRAIFKMRLVVISSAPIVQKEGENYLYAPYEKEMQLWAKHADMIQFCCPIWKEDKKLLIAPISFEVSPTVALKEFDITSFLNILRAIPTTFIDFIRIFKAIQQADHIHLRCPGNMALIATVVQLFFSKKPKTAKYAGNWDPESKQPLSYKLQKWILSNTFLTKNMQVLVYGDWENQTKNIKPFFTASYFDQEKLQPSLRNLNTEIKCLFVGTITQGKNPVYAIELIKKIREKGIPIRLDLYGNGVDKNRLEAEIAKNKWDSFICFKGNQAAETLKKAYQESHFMVLPSQSEGWPKAVAEAMFWGCVPITTPVSCVPIMLGNGSRGKLLTMDIETDATELIKLLQNENKYQKMSHEALLWSQKYTFDYFEKEIKNLLQPCE